MLGLLKFKNCFIYKTSFVACNRTYYGEVGQTYDLELHRPREPKIPYICHLTFTASGGEFGDIVQVNIDFLSHLQRYLHFNETSTSKRDITERWIKF